MQELVRETLDVVLTPIIYAEALELIEEHRKAGRKTVIVSSSPAETVEPIGEYLKTRGIPWTYHRDNPLIRLIDEQPDHGCDLCSRYRRRAVYEIARGLGANVIAFGHTADDFCESLLRNTMFTGRLSALPAITYSRDKEFRLIRPLVYVTEDITTAYAASPVIKT